MLKYGDWNANGSTNFTHLQGRQIEVSDDESLKSVQILKNKTGYEID
jgi:hypothetical protein